MPSQQHLLIEGDHEVGGVAPIGDRPLADADPVAAGPLGDPGWRLDFGRDDLDGPDAVAHLGADRAEDLATLLGALSGVRNDLDGVLRQALGARLGRGDGGSLGSSHGVSILT